MEAVRSSEKSMHSFQNTWCHTAKSYRDDSVTAFTMPSMYLHFCVILVLCIVVFKGRPMCRHYHFVGFAKYVGKTYMVAYKPKHMRSTTNLTTNPRCQVADSQTLWVLGFLHVGFSGGASFLENLQTPVYDDSIVHGRLFYF